MSDAPVIRLKQTEKHSAYEEVQPDINVILHTVWFPFDSMDNMLLIYIFLAIFLFIYNICFSWSIHDISKCLVSSQNVILMILPKSSSM